MHFILFSAIIAVLLNAIILYSLNYFAPGNIPGGWSAVKEELALKYKEGGYPEMAAMIQV